MALELEGLNDRQGGNGPGQGEGLPIGSIVMTPDHNWFAYRAGEVIAQGSGNFRNLGGGFYVNNLPFKESIDLVQGSSLSRYVRSNSYWRITTEEMLAEWGSLNLAGDRAANMLSIMFARMSQMIVAMSHKMTSNSEEAETMWRSICRSASLATGFYTAEEKAFERHLPHETDMVDHFDKSRQAGFMYRKQTPGDGDIMLEFRLPLFSHTRRILSKKVPAASIWKRAIRPESMSEEQFLKEVRAMNKPALVRALLTPHDERDREWVSAFIDHGGSSERSRFLLDEMDLIRDVPAQIDSVLIGEEWEDAVLLPWFNALSEYCGGDLPASLSWSASIVAENLLVAPNRTGRNKNSHASGDAVWLSAADRVIMAPLVEALEGAGSRIVSARMGRIKVIAPRVPEVVSAMLWTAWDHGAYLDFGSAEILKSSKVCLDLPAERESFAGTDADFMVAAANHLGDRSALWRMDAIPHMPKEERDHLLKQLSLLP